MRLDPDVVKRLQQAPAFTVDPHVVKRLQQAPAFTVDPDVVKRLQQAPAFTVDPNALERARASLAVPLGQLRLVGDAAVGELEPGRSQPVVEFADALLDTEDSEEDSEEDLVADWLMGIGTVQQRRLLLLGLGALSAVLDAVDADADVPLPAHLPLIINALIAIAILLNEAIARSGE